MYFSKLFACLVFFTHFVATHANNRRQTDDIWISTVTHHWANVEEHTHFDLLKHLTAKINNFYRRRTPPTEVSSTSTLVTYLTGSPRLTPANQNLTTHRKPRFKLDCTNPSQTTSYFCIAAKYKQNPQFCSTRSGDPSALSHKLPTEFWKECSRLVTCKVNSDAVILGANIETRPECLRCGYGSIDAETKGCQSTPKPGSQSWNEQCDDADINLIQCREFKPNCNLLKYARHNLCLKCSAANPDPKCRNIECKRGGKHRGLDICEHYTFDCKDPQFQHEDACLDCKHLNKDHPKCKFRKCYKGQPDAGSDICMTWEPDCSVPEHKQEDICLDCKIDESSDCKRPDGSDWDCNGVDAHKPICYYSTTSTSRTITVFDHFKIQGRILDLEDTSNTSEQEVTEKKQKRKDYLTSTSVPTFIIVSVLAAVLFILMHMPKCCFGVCREPNWEEYGRSKDGFDDEKLDQP